MVNYHKGMFSPRNDRYPDAFFRLHFPLILPNIAAKSPLPPLKIHSHWSFSAILRLPLKATPFSWSPFEPVRIELRFKYLFAPFKLHFGRKLLNNRTTCHSPLRRKTPPQRTLNGLKFGPKGKLQLPVAVLFFSFVARQKRSRHYGDCYGPNYAECLWISMSVSCLGFVCVCEKIITCFLLIYTYVRVSVFRSDLYHKIMKYNVIIIKTVYINSNNNKFK